MTNTSLKIEINSLPKELRDEVANFVAALKRRATGSPKWAEDFDECLDDFKDYM